MSAYAEVIEEYQREAVKTDRELIAQYCERLATRKFASTDERLCLREVAKKVRRGDHVNYRRDHEDNCARHDPFRSHACDCGLVPPSDE
jgi:hypothetical protein